jgi:hypothetical protein
LIQVKGTVQVGWEKTRNHFFWLNAIIAYSELIMTKSKEKDIVVILIQHHAQHEYLIMLIGHHLVNIKSRKSIGTLMVSGCSYGFSMQHGELSRIKNIMNEKKTFF